MDNDSTSIQCVREVHGNITKLSDTNHTKKKMINALYDLKKSHKEFCSSKTANYIAKMIMYGVHQKQGDVLGLRAGLEQSSLMSLVTTQNVMLLGVDTTKIQEITRTRAYPSSDHFQTVHSGLI